MSTAAEQYRMLVSKLEAINEEEKFPQLRIGDIDPRNGKKIVDALVDGSGFVVRSRYGDIWNVKYGEPDPVKEPEKQPEKEPEKAPAEPEVTPVPTPSEPEVKPLPPLEEPPKPEEKPEVKCGPEVQAEIKKQKTFNAAFALARKSGCDTFDWCQIVKVPGVAPTPTPQPVQGVTTNPMGDFDPTDFSGDFTKPRKQWDWQKGERGNKAGSDLPPAAESIELEEAAFIPGSEDIDRVREIAGTQIIEQNIADIAREQGLKMGTPKDPKTKCSGCGMTYEQHVNPDGTSKVRHPFMYKEEGPGQASTPAPNTAKPAQTPPKKSDTTAGTIPEIKASTKEKAIEIARKKGIKVFRFCGKYGTNLGKKKPNVAPTPKPKPKAEPVQGVTTNPMGDFDPTAFSGDFTGGTKR